MRPGEELLWNVPLPCFMNRDLEAGCCVIDIAQHIFFGGEVIPHNQGRQVLTQFVRLLNRRKLYRWIKLCC